MLTPTLLLSAQLATSGLGLYKNKQASDLQKKQLENERLRMEIAASEASQNRLDQTAQMIAANQAAQAAAGMAAGANMAVGIDEYQAALDDIDAIEFNLQSQVSENAIQQQMVNEKRNVKNTENILQTGFSMFDTLRLT
jgi:hypothetical protein